MEWIDGPNAEKTHSLHTVSCAAHTQQHAFVRSSYHGFNCIQIRTAVVVLRSISSHTGIIPIVYTGQILLSLPLTLSLSYISFLFSLHSNWARSCLFFVLLAKCWGLLFFFMLINFFLPETNTQMIRVHDSFRVSVLSILSPSPPEALRSTWNALDP